MSRVGATAHERVLRVCLVGSLLVAGALAAISIDRATTANAASAPGMVSVNPARFVDTRKNESTVDGKYTGIGRVRAGVEQAFAIAGRSEVPGDATAAMMNITAVRPDGPGHITVYPCGSSRPNVSNINYAGGDVAPNAVLSKLGSKGQICIYSLASTDLIVDVNAYVPAGGTPAPIDPARLADTRRGETTIDGKDEATGRVIGGREARFTVAGRADVPTDASAAMMNITAVRPDGPGHITVYPCGGSRPNVSSINYAGGDVAPNAVLSKLSSDGQICVYSLASTDLIIDVNAYVPAGGTPTPIDPARLADTRRGETTIDGKFEGTGRIRAGLDQPFTIAGRAGVPANATAAMLNITAVRPGGPGHVTVYPCGTPRPNVSSINYRGGDVAPNAVLSKLGTNGQICVYSLATTDLIIDVNAYVPDPVSVNPPTTSTSTSTSNPNSTSSTTTTIDPDNPTTSSSGPSTTTTTTAPGPNNCSEYITIPIKECNALVALYFRTNGPNWNNNLRWNTTADACDWQGVRCASGHVVSIDLNNNRLRGPIPPDIGVLTELNYINFENNELTGSLPTEIGSLTKLFRLDLSSNSLSGTIPSGIWGFGQLEFLDLSVNFFSGPMPTSVAKLTKLIDLRLNLNQLTGTIPTDVGALPNLTGLNLSSNRLTGSIPATIGSLSRLTTINLASNRLTGPIPNQIGTLANLETFNADTNMLNGSLPNEVGQLTKLKNLYLGSNQLSGDIPASLGNLTKLQNVYLNNNALTGTIPTQFTDADTLTALHLEGNKLTGGIPADIGTWTNLIDLNLHGNQLSGTIPALSPYLYYVDLGSNQFTGAVPANIGNLAFLSELDLSKNKLSGVVPATMVNLSRLTQLAMSGNGCLTTTDATLKAWLTQKDPKWNDGC